MHHSKFPGISFKADGPRVSQFKLRRRIPLTGLDREPNDCRLTSSLNEDQHLRLGHIAADWFNQNAVPRPTPGSGGDVNQERVFSAGGDHVTNGAGRRERVQQEKSTNQNEFGGQEYRINNSTFQETPVRQIGNAAASAVPSPPPLFTPDIGDRTAGAHEPIPLHDEEAISSKYCHSTPGLESQAFSPLSKPSRLPGRPQGSTMKLPTLAISPLPHQREETPQFLRRLVHLDTTFSTVTVNTTHESLSFSAFHMLEPTPQRLSQRLGAEADCNLSWSSSMATPISVSSRATSKDTTGVPVSEMDSPCTWKPIIAKVLFMSGEDPQKEVQSLGTENSSEPLESLHLSSTEEDGEPVMERIQGKGTSGPVLRQNRHHEVTEERGDTLLSSPTGQTCLQEEASKQKSEAHSPNVRRHLSEGGTERHPQIGTLKTEKEFHNEGEGTPSEVTRTIIPNVNLFPKKEAVMLRNVDVQEGSPSLGERGPELALPSKLERTSGIVHRQEGCSERSKNGDYEDGMSERGNDCGEECHSKDGEQVTHLDRIVPRKDLEPNVEKRDCLQLSFPDGRTRGSSTDVGQGMVEDKGIQQTPPPGKGDSNKILSVEGDERMNKMEELQYSEDVPSSTVRCVDTEKKREKKQENGAAKSPTNLSQSKTAKEDVNTTRRSVATLRILNFDRGSRVEIAEQSGSIEEEPVDQVKTLSVKHGTIEATPDDEPNKTQSCDDGQNVRGTEGSSLVSGGILQVSGIQRDMKTEGISAGRGNPISESMEGTGETLDSNQLRSDEMTLNSTLRTKDEVVKLSEVRTGLLLERKEHGSVEQMEDRSARNKRSLSPGHQELNVDLEEEGTAEPGVINGNLNVAVDGGQETDSPKKPGSIVEAAVCKEREGSERGMRSGTSQEGCATDKPKGDINHSQTGLRSMEQGTEEESEGESDMGEHSGLREDVEDGLSDRLAILAQTLNIPLAQMIEADKKARELQQAARKQKRRTMNGRRVANPVSKLGKQLVNGERKKARKFTKPFIPDDGKPLVQPSLGVASPSLEQQNEMIQDKNDTLVDNSMNSSSGSLPKESLKPSNIEDTLAFFLATPPLVKRRLSTSKRPATPESAVDATRQRSRPPKSPVERKLPTSEDSLVSPDGQTPQLSHNLHCGEKGVLVSGGVHSKSWTSGNCKSPPGNRRWPTAGNPTSIELKLLDEEPDITASVVAVEQYSLKSLEEVEKIDDVDGKIGSRVTAKQSILGGLKGKEPLHEKDQTSRHSIQLNAVLLPDNLTTPKQTPGQHYNGGRLDVGSSKASGEMITPPKQDSVTAARLFSPPTPNMTEAMLRVTEEVSSSFEDQDEDSTTGRMDGAREGDKRGEGLADVKTVSVTARVPLVTVDDKVCDYFRPENVATVEIGARSSMNIGGRRSHFLTDNAGSQDLPGGVSGSHMEKTLAETGGKEENEQDDPSLSISHLKPKRNAAKFLYSVTREQPGSGERSPAWQQNAVLDKAFIEQEEEKRREMEVGETDRLTNPDGGQLPPVKPKLRSRPRNGQFQTFNSFCQRESKQGKTSQLAETSGRQRTPSHNLQNISAVCNKEGAANQVTSRQTHLGSSRVDVVTLDQTSPVSHTKPIIIGPGGDACSMADSVANRPGVNKVLFPNRTAGRLSDVQRFQGVCRDRRTGVSAHSPMAASPAENQLEPTILKQSVSRGKASLDGSIAESDSGECIRQKQLWTDQNPGVSTKSSASGFKCPSEKLRSLLPIAMGRAKHFKENVAIGADDMDQQPLGDPSSADQNWNGKESVGLISAASGKTLSTRAIVKAEARDFMKSVDFDQMPHSNPTSSARNPNCEESVHCTSAFSAGFTSASSAGFTSASGKKISISAMAMGKAKRSMESMEVGEDYLDGKPHGNLSLPDPNLSLELSAGFRSASGRKISISASAMEKAKCLMEDVELETASPLQPPDIAGQLSLDQNSNQITDKPFVGFKSASGKSITISTSAMEKAKHLMESVDLGEDAETDGTVDGSSSGRRGDMSTNLGSHGDSLTESDQAICTGFSNASGKPIHISGQAFEAAEQKMLESESDTQLAVGNRVDTNQETADRQLCGNASESPSDYHRDGSKESLEQRFRNEEFIDEGKDGGDARFRTSVVTPSKPAPKKFDPSKDYSHIPKGFRPFKPPGKLTTGGRTKKMVVAEECPQRKHQNQDVSTGAATVQGRTDTSVLQGNDRSRSLLVQKSIEDDAAMPVSDPEERPREAAVKSLSKRPLVCVADVPITLDNKLARVQICENTFEAEENNTQVVQEIAAAEEAEMLYDFMRDDEDDVVDTQIDSLLTTSADRVSCADEVPCSNRTTSSRAEVIENTSSKEEMGTEKSSSKVLMLAKPLKSNQSHGLAGPKARKKKKVRFSDEFAVEENEENSMETPTLTKKRKSDDVRSAKNSDQEEKQISGIHLSPSCGFQTAGGTEVKISREAIKKAKQMWCDDETSASLVNGPGESNKSQRVQDMSFRGFQTASGTKVEVSREALQKAKQMWCDDDISTGSIDGLEDLKDSQRELPPVPPNISFSGFQTASGTKVEVSREALRKANQMWSENDVSVDEIVDGGHGKSDELQERKTFMLPHKLPSCGFQTASGTKVAISEEALDRTRKMWSDEDKICVSDGSPKNERGLGKRELKTRTNERDVSRLKSMVNLNSGVGTAGGARIEVSSSALKQTKRRLSGEDGDEMVKKRKIEGGPLATMAEEPNSIGRDVLRHSWDDEKSPVDRGIQSTKDFSGFQTASGSMVVISEAALKRARQLLADDVEYASDDTHAAKAPSAEAASRISCGSKTAGGSQVKVTWAAQHEAKALITEESGEDLTGATTSTSGKSAGEADDVDDHAINPRSNHAPGEIGGRSAGFRTASGNKVTISESALQRARNLFADGDDRGSCAIQADVDNSCPDVSRDDSSTPMRRMARLSSGFQTAGGRKVPISESALQRARHTFAEDIESGLTETQYRAVALEQRGRPESPTASSNPRRMSSGFQTAGGNQVIISDAALRRAESLSADENGAECDGTPGTTGVGHDKTDNDSDSYGSTPRMMRKKTSGFQTASGTKVPVSREALRRARSLFSEEAERSRDAPTREEPSARSEENADSGSYSISSKIISNKMKSSDQVSLHNSLPQSGFITGNGRTVAVSEDSLGEADEECRQGGGNAGTLGNQMNGERSIEVAHKKWQNDLESEPSRESLEATRSFRSTPMSGFQTGSGKSVTVSESALQMARQKWQSDADPKLSEESSAATSFRSTPMSGFQTGGGKSVTVSESALQMARQKWQSDADPKLSEESSAATSFRSTPMSGFQTGGGKSVTVSESALQMARQKWQSDADPKLSEESSAATSFRSTPMSGFQTGGGKSVTVSESALQMARQKWQSDADPKLSEESSAATSFRSTPMSGFQTGGGKSVTVSESALQMARQKWQSDADPKLSEESSAATSFRSTPMSGFQTGGGKSVTVSESALQMARQKWQSDADPKLSEESSAATSFRSTPMSGFQTGGGKSVTVSESALQMARQKWQSDADPKLSKESSAATSFRSTPMSGFQTRGGKSVTVSESALQMARQKWQSDADPKPSKESLAGTSFRSTPMSGFQTGGGKSVTVSESALKMARQKWPRDADPEPPKESLAATSFRSTPMPGFQTGGGKSVTVSVSALKMARQNWQSDADPKPSKESFEATGIFQGTPMSEFQTSSGKNVTVSESALKIAPQKWQTDVHREVMKEGMAEAGFISSDPVSGFSTGNVTSREQGASRCNNEDGSLRGTTERRSFPTMSPRCPPSTPRGSLNKLAEGQTVHTSQFTQRKNGNPVTSDPPGVSPRYQPIRKSPSNFLTDRSRRVGQFKPITTQMKSQDEAASRPLSVKAKIFQKGASSKVPELNEPDGGMDLKLIWECARLAQAKRIRGKKKLVIRPLKGSLTKLRKDGNCLGLREAVNGELPQQHSEQELYSAGVLPSVLNISAEMASLYRFEGIDFFSQETLASPEGILSGDGGRLVLAEDGTAGPRKFADALMDTPGVDPSLISVEWAENHYRWIVWKLASMEVAYPHHFGGRLLTPDRVLLQLKHRYDREVDQSQRSALKKILERDEAPSRRMVLCVAGVIQPSTAGGQKKPSEEGPASNLKQMLLTDGWYAVRTIIDPPLSTLVDAGKVSVGTKLCIFGAELVGSQDACPPLEIPESLALKISCNSTRRARFNARLGLQRDPRPFPVPVRTIYRNGGAVGCVDVIIARVYPTQYMEKYPDGSSAFRGLRAEERAAAEFLKTKQRMMERLYAQIQGKYEEKEKDNRRGSRAKDIRRARTFTQEEVSDMSTGEELFAALSASLDPGSLQACLTPRQMSLLQEHQRTLNERRNQDMQEEMRDALAKQQKDVSFERKVVSLAKMRVTDYYGRQRGRPPDSSVLTIWRPAEELIAQLVEGKRFQITGLSASGARFQWGSSYAQLASSRMTRYLEKPVNQDMLDGLYQPREVTSLCDLSAGSHHSLYSEVDVVGLVASVQGGTGHLQKVHLTDQHGNMVEVRFWTGLKSHYLDDVVKSGQFITASNLQIRGPDTSTLHVTEMSVLSINPKAKVMQEALQALREEINDVQSVLMKIEAALPQQSHSGRPVRTPMRERGSQRFVPFDGGAVTPKGSVPQSGVPTTPTQDTGAVPESLSAKKGDLERRHGLLCRLPSPPPLDRLPIGPSPHLRKAFRTPCRKPNFVHDAGCSTREGGACRRVEDKNDRAALSRAGTHPLGSSVCSKHLKGAGGPQQEESVGNHSRGPLLTDTQEARMEVSELTDIEIHELQESWSQPLSYSSQDETDEGGVEGVVAMEKLAEDGITPQNGLEGSCRDRVEGSVRSDGEERVRTGVLELTDKEDRKDGWKISGEKGESYSSQEKFIEMGNGKQEGENRAIFRGEADVKQSNGVLKKQEVSDRLAPTGVIESTRQNHKQEDGADRVTGDGDDDVVGDNRKPSSTVREGNGAGIDENIGQKLANGATGIDGVKPGARSLSRRKRGMVGQSSPGLKKKRKLGQGSSHEVVTSVGRDVGSDVDDDVVACLDSDEETGETDVMSPTARGEEMARNPESGGHRNRESDQNARCGESLQQDGSIGVNSSIRAHIEEGKEDVCLEQSVSLGNKQMLGQILSIQGRGSTGEMTLANGACHSRGRGHQGGGDALAVTARRPVGRGNEARNQPGDSKRCEGNYPEESMDGAGNSNCCYAGGNMKNGALAMEAISENQEVSSVEASEASQLSVPCEVAQQQPVRGGRGRGRRKRTPRSNVNLALLDEVNLKESPEHERLSGRLRNRPRPSYRE